MDLVGSAAPTAELVPPDHRVPHRAIPEKELLITGQEKGCPPPIVPNR